MHGEAVAGAGHRDRVMHPASTFTQLEGPESELHLPLAPLPNHEAFVGVHFEVGGAHGALGHVGAVQFARAAGQTVPQHRARRPVLARHPRAHVSLSPLLPHGVVEPLGPHHHRGRRGVVGAYKAWVVLCVDVDPPRTSVSWLHPLGQVHKDIYTTRTCILEQKVHISDCACLCMQCDAVRQGATDTAAPDGSYHSTTLHTGHPGHTHGEGVVLC